MIGLGGTPVEPVNYKDVGPVMAPKTEATSSPPNVQPSTVEDKASKSLSLYEFLQSEGTADDIYESIETKERGGSVDTLDYESDDSIDGGLDELPALETRVCF